jgi:hypothetical protein
MSDTKSSNPKDVLARGEERCLLHLVPSPGLIATAQAMADGARKYGPYNWREEGVGATTYVSAALRHLRSWLDGEEQADDSGVHHLGHAAACIMILLDAQAVDNLVDDRPAPAPTADLLNAIKRGPDRLEFDFEEPFDGSGLVHHMDLPVPPAEVTLKDYPFGEPIVDSVVSGFTDQIDPDPAGVKTTVIEAADVYEDPWPFRRPGPVPEEPHPDPTMAELGFGAEDAEPGPPVDEPYQPSESFTDEYLETSGSEQYKRWLKDWGLVDPIPLVFGKPIFDAFKTPGKGMAEMLEEAQEAIIEEIEEQGIKNARGFVKGMEVVERPVELGYKQVSRKAHFRSDVAGYHWSYDPACPCVRCEEETYRKGADSPNSEPTPNPNGGVA